MDIKINLTRSVGLLLQVHITIVFYLGRGYLPFVVIPLCVRGWGYSISSMFIEMEDEYLFIVPHPQHSQ